MTTGGQPGTASVRVAVDATPLLGQPTGVGVFCRSLLGSLAMRPDVAVSAFAVSWRRRKLVVGRLPRGVAWRQRPMPARPLHMTWRHLGAPPIEWFAGPADVVHGTNFVVPPARGAGAVVTVHDLTVVRYPALCDRSTLVFPELIKAALRRGAWVHTPSRFVADEVIDLLGADPARVRPVPSGTPPVPAAGRPVSPTLPSGTERYVLAIGTAEPRKDLPGLVRAFEAVAHGRPDVALVLAGPPGWGAAQLEEAVAASPVRSRIVRTGWLEEAALAGWLRGATVLAFPSLYEGFGFPPLQAMSVGVPVVATAAGALPEVLGDAALLVAPRDHEALAEALGGLLDDTARVEELVARGRRRAAAFTWEGCAAGMAALYREAASAAAPAGRGRR